MRLSEDSDSLSHRQAGRPLPAPRGGRAKRSDAEPELSHNTPHFWSKSQASNWMPWLWF